MPSTNLPADTRGESRHNSARRADSPAKRWNRNDFLTLGLILAIAAISVGALLHIGWVPSDEGTLASSADRVFHGQLPHRDFAEIYTGGLSLLHATAFWLLGENLFSLRLCAFAFFLSWVPVLYSIVRRFLEPGWAGVVTAIAIIWSYPNYVASMPSWYNLFFATFGAGALLRFLEVRKARWLVLAGFWGGCSLDIKITGLYYVAAVLLFLLFLEQQDAETEPAASASASLLYRVVAAAALVAFVFVLQKIVWSGCDFRSFLNFLLPAAVCAALLLWRERRPRGQGSAKRFLAYLRLLAPFLLGVALPILIFVVPYLHSHAAPALIHGIFGSATSRMTGLAGRVSPPGWIELAEYGIPMMGLFVLTAFASGRWLRALTTVVCVGFTVVLVLFAFPVALHDTLHDLWIMGGILTPLVVVFAALIQSRATTPLLSARIVLLAMLAALCSLVQFPFPWITYFSYTAPMTLLALLATISFRPNPAGRPLLAVLAFFYTGLGLLGMVAEHNYNPDMRIASLYRLDLPRVGHLRIDPTTSGYEELVPFLQAHSPDGQMFCGNDCPQFYFLTGLRNPLPDDTGASSEVLLNAVRSGQLHLVVLNDATFFASSGPSTELRTDLAQLLPHTRTIGKFTVFWR